MLTYKKMCCNAKERSNGLIYTFSYAKKQRYKTGMVSTDVTNATRLITANQQYQSKVMST